MSQIINIHLGQCGINIGSQFWQTVSTQHSISPYGEYHKRQESPSENIDVYFNESETGKYTSRSIFADLESDATDSILASQFGHLVKLENIVCGSGSSSNLWAKGYYTKGKQIIEYSMDQIRNQIQQCDLLQAFQISHSLGGGTGSGFGCLLLNKLDQQYGGKLSESYSLFPSTKVANNTLQIYNSVLSIRNLVECLDKCFAIDNEALIDLCKQNFKSQQPTYKNMNKILSEAMSNITCSYRFPGQLNNSLRKMATNLIPYPRQHFFISGNSSIKPDNDIRRNKYTIKPLANKLFDIKSLLCKVDPRQGRFLTASFIFRGQISSYEVQSEMSALINKQCSYFVEWIPFNTQSSICNIPPKDTILSSTVIGNTTSINMLFKRISQQFTRMFRRKSFLHWYTSEGMEEIQFTQAESEINDLISQYQINWDYGGINEEYQQQY